LEHGLSSPSLCFMATTSSFLCHVFLLWRAALSQAQQQWAMD
jgi:hypothetical protein